METAVNTSRGIKNTKKFARHGGVKGRFSDTQSLPAKVQNKKASRLDRVSKAQRIGKLASQVAMGNPKYAAEQAAISFGSDFVSKQMQKRMNKKRAAELEGVPPKKMTGSGFWAMVALAATKDAFDLFFTATVVLSLFSSVFAVVVALIMVAYFVANDIKITTRKAVSAGITALVEFFPLVAFLPLATFNLFLIKYFENSERLQKIVERVGKGTSKVM